MSNPDTRQDLVERVARAMEPKEWERFDRHVAEHTAHYPSREEQYNAFIFGQAHGYIFERSLKFARVAIAAMNPGDQHDQ